MLLPIDCAQLMSKSIAKPITLLLIGIAKKKQGKQSKTSIKQIKNI